MGLGESNIACLPQATPADALRVGTLDPCLRCILLTERFRRLPYTGFLQRLVRLTRLEPYNAWLLLGPGALRSVRTRCAVLARKAHLPRHPIPGIGVWEPGDTLFATRAGDNLAIPIHQKLRFVKAGAHAGLPTEVIGHRAEERDSIHPLTLHQDLRVCISFIYYVFGREQVARLEGRMDLLDHVIIWCCGRRRLDIDN
jgi:hypothetical protein